MSVGRETSCCVMIYCCTSCYPWELHSSSGGWECMLRVGTVGGEFVVTLVGDDGQHQTDVQCNYEQQWGMRAVHETMDCGMGRDRGWYVWEGLHAVRRWMKMGFPKKNQRHHQQSIQQPIFKNHHIHQTPRSRFFFFSFENLPTKNILVKPQKWGNLFLPTRTIYNGPRIFSETPPRAVHFRPIIIIVCWRAAGNA